MADAASSRRPRFYDHPDGTPVVDVPIELREGEVATFDQDFYLDMLKRYGYDFRVILNSRKKNGTPPEYVRIPEPPGADAMALIRTLTNQRRQLWKSILLCVAMSTFETRHDQMFPKLERSEIDRLRRFGEVRRGNASDGGDRPAKPLQSSVRGVSSWAMCVWGRSSASAAPSARARPSSPNCIYFSLAHRAARRNKT